MGGCCGSRVNHDIEDVSGDQYDENARLLSQVTEAGDADAENREILRQQDLAENQRRRLDMIVRQASEQLIDVHSVDQMVSSSSSRPVSAAIETQQLPQSAEQPQQDAQLEYYQTMMQSIQDAGFRAGELTFDDLSRSYQAEFQQPQNDEHARQLARLSVHGQQVFSRGVSSVVQQQPQERVTTPAID